MNLGLQGLEFLEKFICKIVAAVDGSELLEALAAKIKYSKQVEEAFERNGLPTTVFETRVNTTAPWGVILLPMGQKAARNEIRLK